MANHPLREAREKRGLSQSELSYAVQIATVRISEVERWERYPCPKWRDKLSRFFGIPEHELFPKPADLLDIVRNLLEENERLKQSLSQVGTKTNRDNTRYL